MGKLSILKAVATRKVGRSILQVQKYSPELLVASGIVGLVGAGVMACRSTLKLPEVRAELNEGREIIIAIHGVPEGSNAPATKAYLQDLTHLYTNAVKSMLKLYGPAILLGSLSVACLIGSHHILRGRNLALAGAYTGLDQAFKAYKERVVNVVGEEDEQVIRLNHREAVEVVHGVDGADDTEVKVNMIDMPSQYARWFDDSSREWVKDHEYNLLFLNVAQNTLNDKLKARGHVLLNDVYDHLGLKRTSEGALVGWVWDSENGDNYIDFGIYDVNKPGSRAFVSGYEPYVLLDFNVDGSVYHLI